MTCTPEELFACLLALPLISALLCGFVFRQRGGFAALLSVLLGALNVWVASEIFATVPMGYEIAFNWLTLGDTTLSLSLRYTSVTATMLAVVCGVGWLIQLFSMGYMRTDANRGRYFAGLSLFMFSMLGIVVAGNLLGLFIFWELVGVSSYLLIAHYWQTDAAREASKKAFIMNRVGDLGFLLGIVWVQATFGTLELTALEALVAANPAGVPTGIALLLLCGFIGKSAQFPLQTWLPDAMAGPTPVSALIHAATMVAAGIYLLFQIYFFLAANALALNVVLWLGVAMAVYAGFCAFAQTDIKKILAYSTLSQLGYMAAAVGLGFPGVALFHTVTHAFFKALLFLGAGSVIHACHHQQNIFKMGGLYRRMPITTLTFLIGLLALCGVTFTSGYYSKDAILEAAYLNAPAVFGLLYLGAFLTAAYMGRLFFIAFLGSAKSHAAESAKENGLTMLPPLVILAGLSIVGGTQSLWPEAWATFYAEGLHSIHYGIKAGIGKTNFMLLAALPWVLGLGLAWAFYRTGRIKVGGKVETADALEVRAPRVFNFLSKKLWFDELYSWYNTRVQQKAANVFGFLDTILFTGVLMRGTAAVGGLLSLIGRAMHVGRVNVYVMWFVLGFLLVWLFAQN